VKLDLKNGHVDMSHGSGGRAMADLIEGLFVKAFDNPVLATGDDQARLDVPKGMRLAMSTDSFVISPLFFPGGDIGSLAVHGTVNDVAMAGAKPLWLSAGFILEEGFPLKDLEKIVSSMAKAARDCGVQIVTGDTKVVEKGKGDGVYINTAGVGVLDPSLDLGPHRIVVGDAMIVNGTIGDHGMAVLARRENLDFEEPLLSDSAALADLVQSMIKSGASLHAMRDPTRGGLATALDELAGASGHGFQIEEKAIPIRTVVRGACEILGLDPLYIANEGKLLAFCPYDEAETLLAAMRAHPLGRDAALIGRVVEDKQHFVEMITPLGGRRLISRLAGEPLPRIC